MIRSAFGRAAAFTTVTAVAAISAVGSAALLAVVACSMASMAPSHRLGALWLEYVKMPDERALAIVGDPEGLWVGSASGGHATIAAAEASALESCRKRRLKRRLPGTCAVYARNSQVVWSRLDSLLEISARTRGVAFAADRQRV